jgi:hypothetical protein
MDEERSWRERLRESGDEEGLREPPHHALSNPAEDPDPTEWPDPYDKREDPLDEPDGEGGWHAEPGATSTSEPHPDVDIQAPDANPPARDRLDD